MSFLKDMFREFGFASAHRKINTLEEIEILKAASSKYLLNDGIAGQNDPMSRLLLSVSDLKSKINCQRPGDRKIFDTQQALPMI